MASPGDTSLFLDDIKAVISCPVCKEMFDDSKIPIDLTCPHTCCDACIQSIAGTRNVVECPECRKVTCIPQGGVRKMKINIRLKNLAKIHADYIRNRALAPPKCPHHTREGMYYYCTSCNESLCQICKDLKHKTCVIEGLNDTYDKQHGEMMTVLTETDKEAHLCDESVERLTELEENIGTSISAEQEKITQQEKLTIANIRREAEAQRAQVRQMEEPRLVNIREIVTRLQGNADAIRKKNNEIGNVLEETSTEAYVMQHHQLVAGLTSMLGKDKGKGIDRQIDTTKFVFNPNTPSNVSLGQVVKYRKLEKVDEFGNFDELISITETRQGELVLLDKEAKNNQLQVYEKDENGKYTLKTSVCLASGNTSKPCSVAVGEHGKFLVARGTQIEIYSAKGSAVRSVKIPQGKADVIKITSDGKVLVADADNSMITILSQDLSTPLQSFKTSIAPRCVAVLPHSRIAISHFQSSHVEVIDLNSGEVVQRYDVSNALGLCYQEATDSLLVAHSTKLLSDCTRPLFGHVHISQYCTKTGVLVGKTVGVKVYWSWDMVVLGDGSLAVADFLTAKIFA